MAPIRILLLDMSSMLIDIITNIVASQPDMKIVGQAAGDANLVEMTRRTEPDIVILARSGEVSRRDYNELLYERARIKLLEIIGDGRHGVLHELQPLSVPLGEMSPPVLLDAIRTVVAPASHAVAHE